MVPLKLVVVKISFEQDPKRYKLSVLHLLNSKFSHKKSGVASYLCTKNETMASLHVPRQAVKRELPFFVYSPL